MKVLIKIDVEIDTCKSIMAIHIIIMVYICNAYINSRCRLNRKVAETVFVMLCQKYKIDYKVVN